MMFYCCKSNASPCQSFRPHYMIVLTSFLIAHDVIDYMLAADFHSYTLIVVVEPCVVQPPIILLIPTAVGLLSILLAAGIVTESSSDYH